MTRCNPSTPTVDVVSHFSLMNVLYFILASHFNIWRLLGGEVGRQTYRNTLGIFAGILYTMISNPNTVAPVAL